ncbi:Hypothetical protein I595_3568 [Croceitalea dokdonensis DOKDO 023]|uniref:Uncharacterized protein n=1 Tax=Croceitalea dokdonensis DOKDO 023 TaxID=1300341 RepID=A0A0P7A1L7_9FLAO|nr:hypothetical protein [Croceitalea dokdonensis]KPM30272.1 Hypothetical protein I595_3568 [Croceitalea dokdonensis DOKDO 023]
MTEEYNNPFQQLNRNLKEVPPDMRQKVMNDVAIAKLILDMAVLITANYGSILSGMLRTQKPNQQK